LLSVAREEGVGTDVGRGGYSLLRVTGYGDVRRARVIGKLSLVSNVERPTILLVNAHSNYRSTSISCYLIWRHSLTNGVLKTKEKRNPDNTFQTTRKSCHHPHHGNYRMVVDRPSPNLLKFPTYPRHIRLRQQLLLRPAKEPNASVGLTHKRLAEEIDTVI
jgi:hypothetical protein